MKKLIISCLLFSTMAFAGHDTGGGGIGLKVNGNIYLYDFVEAGIEESLFINPSIDDEMKASKIVKATLITSNEVQDLVIAKMNEIYKISPTLALRFLETLKAYQWRFVKPALYNTRDIGHSPINVNLPQQQIAFRDDSQKTVTIDKDFLSQMPVEHQAGLYFHEIVYAMSEQSDSYKSRLLTSFFFHPSFELTTFEQLQERVKLTFDNSFPVLSYTAFNFVDSNEFKSQCAPFKKEVDKILPVAIDLVDGEIKRLRAWWGYDHRTLYTLDGNILYRDNVSMIRTDKKSYMLPTNSRMPINIYKGSDIVYSIDKKILKSIEQNNLKLKVIQKRHVENLYGACLSLDETRALNYLAELSFVNN